MISEHSCGFAVFPFFSCGCCNERHMQARDCVFTLDFPSLLPSSTLQQRRQHCTHLQQRPVRHLCTFALLSTTSLVFWPPPAASQRQLLNGSGRVCCACALTQSPCNCKYLQYVYHTSLLKLIAQLPRRNRCSITALCCHLHRQISPQPQALPCLTGRKHTNDFLCSD